MPYQYTILNNAKELDQETGWYYYGARYYDPQVSTWLSVDPLAEKNAGQSPYNFSLNNPVRYVDIKGLDTLDITRKKNKWVFTNYQKVKGNDVIRVHVGDMTYSYTYSEGEYGKRVMALTLPEDTKDNFGIYLVSGAKLESGAYGYFVTPGGSRSNVNRSGKTILSGAYFLTDAPYATKWKTLQIVGDGGNDINVEPRGIMIHHMGYLTSKNNEWHSPVLGGWTEGCFILSSDYRISTGHVEYHYRESINTVAFVLYNLGGSNNVRDHGRRLRASFNSRLRIKFLFYDSLIQ